MEYLNEDELDLLSEEELSEYYQDLDNYYFEKDQEQRALCKCGAYILKGFHYIQVADCVCGET